MVFGDNEFTLVFSLTQAEQRQVVFTIMLEHKTWFQKKPGQYFVSCAVSVACCKPINLYQNMYILLFKANFEVWCNLRMIKPINLRQHN